MKTNVTAPLTGALAILAALALPASAGLIAFDGFNSYADGALVPQAAGTYNAANLDAVQAGKSAQSGWEVGWKLGSGTSPVVAAGLSTTLGDKAAFDNTGGSMQAIRQWYNPATDFPNGTVIWASVKVKNTSGGDTMFGLFQQSGQTSNYGMSSKFTTTNNMQVGVRLSGSSTYAANGTSVSGTGPTVSTATSPAYVYLKYTLSTTNNGDRLDVFVNPSADPGANAGDITINPGYFNFNVASGGQQGTGHLVMGGFSSGQVGYDDVRIGTSFADVSPPAVVPPTFVLSPVAGMQGQTLTFTWNNLPPGSNPTLNGSPVTIDGSGSGGTTLFAPAISTPYTLNWDGGGAGLTENFTPLAPSFTLSPASGYLGDTLTLNWRVPVSTLPATTTVTLTPSVNGVPGTPVDLTSPTSLTTGVGTTTLTAPSATTVYTLSYNFNGTDFTLPTQTFTLLPSFLNVTPDPVADGTTLAINWRISPEWDNNTAPEDNVVTLESSSFSDFSSLNDQVTVTTNATTGAGSINTLTAVNGVIYYRLVYKISDTPTSVADTIVTFDPYFNNLVYTPTATNPSVTEKLNFTSGVNAYLDRTHQWVSVPSALVGGHFIQLKQGDRNSDTLGVTFDADEGTTVFVLVDNRVGDEIGGTNPGPGSDSPPVASALPWLASNGFLDSGLDVGSDENADSTINNTYSVFFKQVPVGAVSTSFSLGTMDALSPPLPSAPGRGVYGVVITKPQVVPVSFHAYVGSYDLTLPIPPVTSSTLYWTLPTDATSVSINQSVGSVLIDANGQGNVIVSPTSTTTYTLTASSVSLGPISRQTTVTVIAPLTGFGTWINGNFGGNTVPALQQGANDDPDGDGIDNLVEYAIAGGDPTRSTASPAVISGTLVTFNKNTAATGISYALEKSSTLANDWVAATPTTNDANVITYTLAPPTPSKEFVRLKVTQP